MQLDVHIQKDVNILPENKVFPVIEPCVLWFGHVKKKIGYRLLANISAAAVMKVISY